MSEFAHALDVLSRLIWGPALLIPLLLGTGIYLTIRLRGLQFRMLKPALTLGLITRKDQGADGDISQFQALMTATAATVGTGNIVGVATAISIGGPGALFWMWMTGLVGMATKYAEAFLAVRFRVTDAHGEKSGGPQYYLARGIGGRFGKFLALWFAICAIIACFGIGNLTQGNAIATNVEGSWGVAPWLTGAVLSVLAFSVLVGGIRSIGRVTAWLVPGMIVFYVGSAAFILALNVTEIPRALVWIVQDAFQGTAAVGGFAGSSILMVMQYGVSRGLFSNESGLGSAPMAAAAAKTAHPVRQGLVSMTQTFIDTLIVVTMTGLVIVTTGAWQTIDPGTGKLVGAAKMTGWAFSQGLPGQWGHWVVTAGIVLFAFSTLLGWCYYGERNVERLLGVKFILPYRVAFSLMVFVGCTSELSTVWAFSDVANGLMALPNLLGILLLSNLIVRETRVYLRVDPTLNADADDLSHRLRGQRSWMQWQQGERSP